MALQGQMIKMKMSDGAEIGVYHVAAERQAARRARAHPGNLRRDRAHQGTVRRLRRRRLRSARRLPLYDREAPGLEASYTPEDIQKAIKIARADHPFDLSIKDTQVCIDALKSKGPVFITGYCYGGSVTWAAACRSTDWRPRQAITAATFRRWRTEIRNARPSCISASTITASRWKRVEKIKSLHPDVTVYIYDAGHGFNSDRRTDYNEACAKLARERTLELFRANGG